MAGGFLGDHWLGQSELRPPSENRSLTKHKLIIDGFRRVAGVSGAAANPAADCRPSRIRHRHRDFGSPDALYLISDPVDGATTARQWVSQGGVLLNDGMSSDDFITAVGKENLGQAFGTASGSVASTSTGYFNANYKAFSGLALAAPAAGHSYDAGALVGLAIAIAGGPTPSATRWTRLVR